MRGPVLIQNKSVIRRVVLVASLLLGGSVGSIPAQSTGTASVGWQYLLLSESQLTDDCPICGRPTIFVPMRGSFQLRLMHENPLYSTYAMEDIAFDGGTLPGLTYKVRGSGTYSIGGEVALLQNLFLEVSVASAWTNRTCYFTNVNSKVSALWPVIQLSLAQTNGLLTQTFTLDLRAAPLREIWFSTTRGFHAGIWQEPTNYVSPGDLISSAGRVVKRNQELSGRLGIMPIVPDLGLDAASVLPGGELAFSVLENIFSETLGPLRNGDLLSDRGRILIPYATLLGAFAPQPPVADEGLDAVQVMPDGEIYFSTTNDFFSEGLGRLIRRGDLLSNRGVVVKTNEELIARFNPANPKRDYGLDAIHVWPSGEVWFSVETGFTNTQLQFFASGDLLSDQGYVVYRNNELLSAFQPLDGLSDFGLDALWLVSDFDSLYVTNAPLRCTNLTLDAKTGSIGFQWDTPGRVFQLEKAEDIQGPWLPISPILTAPPTTDPGVITNAPRGFYRLHQW